MKKFFAAYRAYIRDNPHGYWFKRKRYGWGWTPATKEGWLVLLGFMVLVIGNGVRLQAFVESETEFAKLFIMQSGALMLLLMAVCYRTGESPRWQWGLPEEK